jgi:hypothetical protein
MIITSWCSPQSQIRRTFRRFKIRFYMLKISRFLSNHTENTCSMCNTTNFFRILRTMPNSWKHAYFIETLSFSWNYNTLPLISISYSPYLEIFVSSSHSSLHLFPTLRIFFRSSYPLLYYIYILSQFLVSHSPLYHSTLTFSYT